MKFIRFLTTLIVIHLINIGANASAQDIAEFEFRRLAPTSPFISASEIVPFDDDGYVIPSNQCEDYISPCSYRNRCGFSAGQDSQSVSVKTKPQQEIDLSPMSFRCFDSGCEYEYQNSANEIAKSLDLINESGHQEVQETAKEIFDHVFSNASSVRELIEQQFGTMETENADLENSQFVPYYAPTENDGMDPFSFEALEAASGFAYENSHSAQLAPVVNVANVTSVSNLLIETLSKSEWLSHPVAWAEQQLLDLECKLCGTPAMSLHYNFMAELERQKNRVKRLEQRKLSIAVRSSDLLRFLGNQLIHAADQIAPNPIKNVESGNFDLNSESY